MDDFDSIIAEWFGTKIGVPTETQRAGWKEIRSGKHTLIAAPTGSGKTLAAFLVMIDNLCRQALVSELEESIHLIYVSPLKALSVDIAKNLERPLLEMHQLAEAKGKGAPVGAIRAAVRTGDSTQSERQAMLRRPPHILVTTPESLYLLLTSPRARQQLVSVKSVIVDEIHALSRDKRGTHLALSLERLEEVCGQSVQRIGLSATQKPIQNIAEFLVGTGRHCSIVDAGHKRDLDLDVEMPVRALEAVCSHETWAEIFAKLAEYIRNHRSTVVFVNTRRLAERVGFHLSEILGSERVASHHGSLSKEIRQSVETRLRTGDLAAVVATASLELGIDVGHVELVCQIGSPRSIATFLQRVGRSGHALHKTPKGRLFPLTRDELVESVALLDAVAKGALDAVEVPRGSYDILSQQLIAEASMRPLSVDDTLRWVKRAAPYQDLDRPGLEKVLDMLTLGFGTGSRRSALLHWDKVADEIRAKRSARLTALLNGGAIPELADYRVVTVGEGAFVGSVNEDFALESMAGDVFQLGNSSWRIVQVRGSEVVVADAQGAPATIPFWLGEAPGRSFELSAAVSELRETIDRGLSAHGSVPAAVPFPFLDFDLNQEAQKQLTQYLFEQKAALGMIPSFSRIVFERFFDESGGMQLVIHSPLGARINRAWGLALRKRFCRSFNFELQAAATDNGLLLSLGTRQSFPIDQLFTMLRPDNCREILVQALLDIPMFLVRWRWNTTRALAVKRNEGGKRVPPFLQRFRADDLLTAVFPTQTACKENVVGDIVLPDHPLVEQTIYDCLTEAMDVVRFEKLVEDITLKRVELLAIETTEPSPFSHELIHANPYAFLDDAPLEERRVRAVTTRRVSAIGEARDLAALDPQVISEVEEEVRSVARDADELYDALMGTFILTESEMAPWRGFAEDLLAQGRIFPVSVSPRNASGPDHAGGTEKLRRTFWTTIEHFALVEAAYGKDLQTLVDRPDLVPSGLEPEEALGQILRGRLEHSGPVTAAELSETLCFSKGLIEATLAALEGEGTLLRGSFRPRRGSAEGEGGAKEWCERRILARIHRATIQGLRERIRPVSKRDFVRFLCDYQGATVASHREGKAGLLKTLSQLQGFEAPARSWEAEILPLRMVTYDSEWMDEALLVGRVGWARLRTPRVSDSPDKVTRIKRSVLMHRGTPIVFAERAAWTWLLSEQPEADVSRLSAEAEAVLNVLQSHGALFESEVQTSSKLLGAQVTSGLRELAGFGLVSCDGFQLVRSFMNPSSDRQREVRQSSACDDGRWYAFSQKAVRIAERNEAVNAWALQLLRRYGVVFREILQRERFAPRWWELLQVFRRMEARGEVRGGRFVDRIVGEQYALPHAVDRLRQIAQDKSSAGLVIVSAADPLNLPFLLGGTQRVPSVGKNVLVLRDGEWVASREGEKVDFSSEVSKSEEVEIQRLIQLQGKYRARLVLGLS